MAADVALSNEAIGHGFQGVPLVRDGLKTVPYTHRPKNKRGSPVGSPPKLLCVSVSLWPILLRVSDQSVSLELQLETELDSAVTVLVPGDRTGAALVGVIGMHEHVRVVEDVVELHARLYGLV